jgi:nucleoside-diphosphate-sugar epimerase
MTIMRLLITGITGFVGSHMAEYALSKGAEVVGSARWRSRTENIEHLRGKVQLWSATCGTPPRCADSSRRRHPPT